MRDSIIPKPVDSDEPAKEKEETVSRQEENRRGLSHGSQRKEMFQEAQKIDVGAPGKCSHILTQGYAPQGLMGILKCTSFLLLPGNCLCPKAGASLSKQVIQFSILVHSLGREVAT